MTSQSAAASPRLVPTPLSKARRKISARNVILAVIALPIVLSGLILLAGLCLYRAQHAAERSKALASTTQRSSPSIIAIDDKDVKYHVIFSTGCSAYQDWQSFVFFHRAWVVKQPGIVTRVVSGCNPEDQATLQSFFDSMILPMAPERFRIHFTPDFSRVKPGTNYKYFNKPFGTKHWLESALGFPDNPIDEDSIVILMDPDQLILRPFRDNDFSNSRWMFMAKSSTPRTRVAHGAPMGQLYGFGLQWKDKVDITKVAPANELPSPIETMSNLDARAGYGVGPPYIATARDMYTIASKWSEFAPAVHDQYPHLLAEMFAYCLAAAHLKLSHQTAASFMISETKMGNGEGWNYIADIPDEQLCRRDLDDASWPNLLHYCQRYAWGPYFFGKNRFPKDFLSCDNPLLAEPPTDSVSFLSQFNHPQFPDGSHKSFDARQAKNNVFILCHMIPAINEAGAYFKQQQCGDGANLNKTLVFNKNMGNEFQLFKG